MHNDFENALLHLWYFYSLEGRMQFSYLYTKLQISPILQRTFLNNEENFHLTIAPDDFVATYAQH